MTKRRKMNISDEQLKKFKKICKNHTGSDLSDEEALKQANRLLTLISITRKPLPKESN